MISDLFIQLGTMFSEALAGLFPPVAMPTWPSDMIAALTGFLDATNGLGAWVPWVLIQIVFGGLVTFYVTAFGVKLIRAVASYVPLFGGAG